MYKVSRIIEECPRDYTEENFIEYCTRLQNNQAIAFQFGDLFLDPFDAHEICIDAYLHACFNSTLNWHVLKDDYSGKIIYKRTAHRSHASGICLDEIINKLQYRLGFSYRGSQTIDLDNDDYLKRNFSPGNVPFHMPVLLNEEAREKGTVQDFFICHRILVELM